MYKIKCADFFLAIKEIPDLSVDLVIADPPYFLSNGGVTCRSGKVSSVDKGNWDKSRGNRDNFNFHYQWIKECRRVLKNSGSLWVSGTYHSIYDCGLALKILGYHPLNEVCWYKPNATPNIMKRQFKASHETLIWAKKTRNARHTFNYSGINDDKRYIDAINPSREQVGSVWSIDTVQKKEKVFGYHPTQKPEQLIYRMIVAATNVGDTILDPFMGSGTVGACSIREGRRFVGFEQERQFFNIAKKRISSIHLRNHD